MGIFGNMGKAPNYDTPLTAEQVRAYRIWRASLPASLQNTDDYDLQGAFLRHAQQSGRAHLDDAGKKPNHMTFSDQSMYSTPANPGGSWQSAGTPNPFVPGEESYVFWASPANLLSHSASSLADYFRQSEPGNAVVLPLNYKLPRR